MSDWALQDDVVLWPGRGLYVVRLVYGGDEVSGGVRHYDLDGLEGQERADRVEAWRCRKVQFPLPEIRVKARRR